MNLPLRSFFVKGTPEKHRPHYASFGHMPNVKLSAHIATVQLKPTTIPEAIPILLRVTATKQQPDHTAIITETSLLENHFRTFVHVTAILNPFVIPQYLPDIDEPDFASYWAGIEDVPTGLKNVLAFEPLVKPIINCRQDPSRYFRARWRGQWNSRITYYHPSTQVLQGEVAVNAEKRKLKVYFHLMRHGEVLLDF
jgi:hypothetical protein